MICNVGVTRRTEQDGVFTAERFKTVFGHHDAVFAVVITTPVKTFKFKSKAFDLNLNVLTGVVITTANTAS